jgi:hypothetical protein
LLNVVVEAVVEGGFMLLSVRRFFGFSVIALLMASCGAQNNKQVQSKSETVPNYVIARADVSDKESSTSNVDFVTVKTDREILTAEDAELAFNSGDTIRSDESGRMVSASRPDVEFGLGSPAQMSTQSPTQMGTGIHNKSTRYKQVYAQNNCECSYGNGVVRSNQNTVLFPRLNTFFQRLNPFARVGQRQYPYSYGNQYNQGQYQYTVYKQPQQPSQMAPVGSQQQTQSSQGQTGSQSNPNPNNATGQNSTGGV